MSSRHDHGPPEFWEACLSTLLPAAHADAQLGDLAEGYQRRARRDPHEARRWYRRQVLRSLPGALRLRWQARRDPRPESATAMETLLQDLRYALRALKKAPGFAVVATLTLAVAIGVNTSIFSLVSAVVFADLPMQNAETMSIIRGTNAELGIDQGSVSPGDFLDLRERAESFTSVSAFTESEWILTGGDRPIRVSGAQVTSNHFETWQLPPVLGRDFAEGEDIFGAEPVVMLTHGFWQSHFDGDPQALGQTLRLDDQNYTIIGVANPQLESPLLEGVGIVTPLILNRAQPNRSVRYLFVSGRLAPGVIHERATAEVRQIGEELAAEYPADDRGWGLWSAPVMESIINPNGQRIFLLLQIAVGMVILIACANVANMLLARATARRREMAVRSAIGAGRRRLIRQLLTESFLISSAAAGLGVLFAIGLNEAMIWVSAGTEPLLLMAEFDVRVFTFTFLVALVAPLVFGLFPAMRASAQGPQAALRDGRGADGGLKGMRVRSFLVTAQVALALTLLVVASLISRTVVNMQTRPLGFDASDVVAVSLNLPESRYPEGSDRIAFYERAAGAVSAPLGGASIELTNVIPAADYGARRSFEIQGQEVLEGRASPVSLVVTVSEGYLNEIGLPVEDGRGFNAADLPNGPGVVVIAQALADRYFPAGDAVGSRIRLAGEDEWLEVIGVASDVRSRSETESGAPNVYRLFDQAPLTSMYLVARTSIDPVAAGASVREAIWSIDRDLPVDGVQTMTAAQHEAGAANLALLSLFVTFAVFALFLSAIGIYGVVAYSVSQRQTEIGVRMALGAERGAVRRMILGQGGRLIATGVGVGLMASFGVSTLMRSVVFGISPTDPITFVGAPLLLILVALAANLLPAIRATRLDPAKTLRAD